MITVHLTTYRRYGSGLLQRAIDSVLAQSFENFELVVCDDASVDGTAEFLADLERRDGRVRVFRNDRNVNSVALSLGRCLERSDPGRPFVTWMFDDCELKPYALQYLVDRLKGEPQLEIVFGTTAVHGPDGPLLVGDAEPEKIRAEINDSPILVPNAGILVHRDVFARFGWYDASALLRRSCDWDFFRRVITGGVAFANWPDVLCDERGAEQRDSLRNTFTTSLALMRKYASLRDRAGWDLSLDSSLHHPVDRIPEGAWTHDELAFAYYVFVEYFVSVADFDRAAVWARRLAESLEDAPFYLDRLARLAVDDRAALGAFCALACGAYRAPPAHRER